MAEITTDTCMYGSPDFEKCKRIRKQVFVDEQGFSEESEFDKADETYVHILLKVDGMPAATARCTYDDENGDVLTATVIAGRICILPEFRQLGLGRHLMSAIEKHFPADTYKVHAQLAKQGFYEKCGYTAIPGSEDDDEGVPHIWMQKHLEK